MGYARAGFEVVGVDINPQPHYPFEFHQMDAKYVTNAEEFDAVHASPPCQQFTVLRNCRPGAEPRWPDLIEPTRQQLESFGLPYVMENVPGAPMKNAIQLCGTSFGLEVRRHRLFELGGWFMMTPTCQHDLWEPGRWVGSTNRPNGRTVAQIGTYRIPLERQKAAMGVDWKVTLHELSEAIPPAYTEFIGHQLLQHLAPVGTQE